MPTGMLTKNTHGHENVSVSKPPRTGPTVGPMITPTEKIACAAACLSAGKLSRNIACDVEMRPPPPSPWITRQNTSSVSERDSPHISEAAVKIKIDVKKYCRRPKRRCSHGVSGITMTFATM